MKRVGSVVGVVLLLLGVVWRLQGANIMGGSSMSGQSQWLYIGAVVAVLGAALFFLARRSGPRL